MRVAQIIGCDLVLVLNSLITDCHECCVSSDGELNFSYWFQAPAEFLSDTLIAKHLNQCHGKEACDRIGCGPTSDWLH